MLREQYLVLTEGMYVLRDDIKTHNKSKTGGKEMKKKWLSALLTVAMVATMAAGCAGSDEKKDDGGDKGKSDAKVSLKVGWAPPNVTGVFETAENYMDLAIKDAKKNGVDIKLTTVASPDETQYENQVKAIENLIQSDMDVIICSPGSIEAVTSALKEANNKGIPLILVNVSTDSVPKDVDVASVIGFDNREAGTVSGYALLDQLGGPGVVEPGEAVDVSKEEYLDLKWWDELYKDFDYSTIKGKIAIIEGIAGSYYSNERLAGFHSVVDKCKDLEVVSTLAGDWDREKGTTAAENILQANKELDAIWAASNEMGMGASIAAANMDRSEVLVSTNDGTPESIEMIMDGKLVTETWHGFPEWGWYGIQFATQLALEQEVPEYYDIRPRTEYKGNTDMFYPTAQLDEIPWDDILSKAGK